MYLPSLISNQTHSTFEHKLQTNFIGYTIAKVISIILFGLIKSYINSKPLGMQTLYDIFSKLFINFYLAIDFLSTLNLAWANFFGPIPRNVATLLAFSHYFLLTLTFTCLLCVQIVRYLYLTHPDVLDYFEENKTINVFKKIVVIGSVIFTFTEVSIPKRVTDSSRQVKP